MTYLTESNAAAPIHAPDCRQAILRVHTSIDDRKSWIDERPSKRHSRHHLARKFAFDKVVNSSRGVPNRSCQTMAPGRVAGNGWIEGGGIGKINALVLHRALAFLQK